MSSEVVHVIHSWIEKIKLIVESLMIKLTSNPGDQTSSSITSLSFAFKVVSVLHDIIVSQAEAHRG